MARFDFKEQLEKVVADFEDSVVEDLTRILGYVKESDPDFGYNRERVANELEDLIQRIVG